MDTNRAMFRPRRQAAVRYDLSPAAYRVLFFINSRQKADEPGLAVTGTQIEMARALGSSQPTVSKALRQLREAGVIRPVVSGVWNIHSHYMFGGYQSEDVVALPFAA
ncbi:MarR family transcriptional regulator [Streptomyces subrutilus]|uniref:HTH crp-type domain-containing protein n=1 Tax=Streptomyces subrutilus TaxID=36818 RepID=A0A1E5PX64_9ACTN|nr:helix-turn-helix domain-containing protein [Streptomyces subrutilus]OEJ34167.1 hypothetical protein BGK67_25055 [Streptomyces subrutilus]